MVKQKHHRHVYILQFYFHQHYQKLQESYLKDSGVRLVIPSHYEGVLYRGDDVSGRIEALNARLREAGCVTRILNQERYRWYRIYTGIAAE